MKEVRKWDIQEKSIPDRKLKRLQVWGIPNMFKEEQGVHWSGLYRGEGEESMRSEGNAQG